MRRFQVDRRRDNWLELAGLRGEGSGCSTLAPQWQPGAGGMCLHTILLDRAKRGSDVHRDFCCRRFSHDDGGLNWKRSTRACFQT